MTIAMRRAVRWALCGGAFIAAVATANGCMFSSNSKPHASTESPTATVPAHTEPAAAPTRSQIFENTNAADATSDAESKAPSVNIFGEFDGAAPLATNQASEAGFQQHTFVDEGFDGDVAASPDGKWLAFASTRHSEHPDIYLQRVDGQSVTQLTCDDADDAFPAFSPNGKQIAFSSTRAGSWDIYVMDIDGKGATQVTAGPAQDLHPSFSPDGKRLVYCSAGARSGNWELWTVNIATGEKRMIGVGLFPSWSPDKTRDRIAFQRARQRGSRWFSLWTLDLVDGEARRVTEVAASSNAAVVSPTWSPDGKRLAFATIVHPGQAAPGTAHGQQDIWIVSAEGTNRQRLTDGTGINATPFWSADNRVFFVSDRGGTECVWSTQAPGPEMRQTDVASGSHEAKSE